MQENLLQRVLEAKEERAAYQKQLINHYQLPLISLTLNLPGGYFQYTHWQELMDEAVKAINGTFENEDLFKDSRVGKWGPEGFWIINLPIEAIKRKTIAIEDIHPLGRLFDIDVINIDGKAVSRRDFSMEARKCILCYNTAVACYVEKRHTREELKLKIDEIIKKGLKSNVRE